MLHNYKDNKPQISKNVFIAPGSQIIANVIIEKDASIWFNAVLRGDINKIQIGEKTNIQENSSLHVDFDKPLIIGKKVTVGHGVILHGCTIEDNCLIGMGATILNGAIIGKGSVIGANALITEGKVIPPNSLVIGMPAKVKRELTEEELLKIEESAEHYYKFAQEYMKDN